jgi:hypothetical protein
MVSIKVAGCSAELCRKRDVAEQLDLVLNSLNENHQFFSQAGRGCGLTMRAGEHWYLVPLLCQGINLMLQVDHGRKVFLFN